MSGAQKKYKSLARLGSVAALQVGGLIGAGALTAGTAWATAASASTPKAVGYNGGPSVGALFGSAQATVHTCTASVIDSPAGDLLITAAHCIRGNARGYVFVPGYHDGQEPFGAWTVTAAFGSSAWTKDRSQAADVAFLAVAPQVRNGHRQTIQSVTGGHVLGHAPGPGRTVTVPAYAAGNNDRPFTCTASVYYDGGSPAFNCNSYPDGTSGSPWLRDTRLGWRVVGVIGGLHQGGCNVVTSYTSSFGADALGTYERAASGRDPDTFPAPGGDGC